MFFATSSPKRGGNGPSGLYDNRKQLITPGWRTFAVRLTQAALLFLCLSMASRTSVPGASQGSSIYVPSKAAAERCAAKLKNLEDFAAKHKSGRKQTKQFSQDEINSYLALDLSAKYHPCLKSLIIALEENGARGSAAIDFDRLKNASGKLLPKLIGLMFSGTHTLNVRGQILSNQGKAHFRLEEARFDDTTLPRYLVEQIMTAVGRRQKPPFDPLHPSKLFYEIEKVDIHSGYLIVYQ
jgi:hypothetical protein